MILEQARKQLQDMAGKHHLDDQEVTITCKTLTPEEAIGNPLHDDYPIQLGKERVIEANFMGKKGQAFSDSYFNYKGSVKDILSLNLETNARRAIFISSLNAIMAYLKNIPETLHCKDDDLMRCADHFLDFVKDQSLKTNNVLLVGLQPRLLEILTLLKNVRVCDLNPDNIGKLKCGIVIDGPERFSDNAKWAGAIFATGSTIVNGTIDEIINADRNTVFYGVTITGVASLLGLKQYCYITETMNLNICQAHQR
ncbi:MAG: hypothetical protein JW943_12005 [Deltaproteobacteria bacterium]|nr:hypothetical protein [Deltaproteobacteria bacterium]